MDVDEAIERIQHPDAPYNEAALAVAKAFADARSCLTGIAIDLNTISEAAREEILDVGGEWMDDLYTISQIEKLHTGC